MNLKNLLNLPELQATEEQMQSALSDPLVTKTVKVWYGSGEEKRKTRKIALYLRAERHGDILAVSLFFPDDLRKHVTRPALTVFLDVIKKEYRTYMTFDKKWRQGKIEYIRDQYASINANGWYADMKYSMSPEEERDALIALTDSRPGMCAAKREVPDILNVIDEWQQECLADRRRARWAEEEKKWDPDNEAISKDVPDTFRKFCAHRRGLEEYFFFESKGRKTTEGYCSRCGKKIVVASGKNVHHRKNREPGEKNRDGVVRCPECGTMLTCKCIKRASRFGSDETTVYLVEPFGKNGYVVRLFRSLVDYLREDITRPVSYLWEIRRLVVDEKGARAYYYGDFHREKCRWIGIGVYEAQRIPSAMWARYFSDWFGVCYIDRRRFRKDNLLFKRGMYEYMSSRTKEVIPEKYACAAIEGNSVGVEMLMKAGLKKLFNEALDSWIYLQYGSRYDHQREAYGEIFCGHGKTLAKKLGIDGYRLKRLTARDGDLSYLKFLRYEKTQNTVYPDSLYDDLCDMRATPDDFEFISGKLTLIKSVNYVRKQSSLTGIDAGSVLREWKDYLAMAKRLRYNIDAEQIYKPANVLWAHNEAVRISNEHEREIKIAEFEEEYPTVKPICVALVNKYAYGDDKYVFRIPNGIWDIYFEGVALNHCVGNSPRYYERIQTNESYIGFLRKANSPDKPYYTVEFEPDGTVRQLRTTGDRQRDDILEIREWLQNKWQQKVAKRLTAEDRKRARSSSEKRHQEFEELRQSGTLIHNGIFAGTPLIDQLEKDLMLADEAEAELKAIS